LNGVASINLTGLNAGAKDAFIEFITTDDYNNNASTTYRFNVFKNETKIIIDVDVIHVGEDAIINVTFDDNATGDVTIYVGDQKFDRTIANHKVNVTVSNLAYGNYTVVVNYHGDVNYNRSSNSTKQIVIKTDMNITLKENATIFTTGTYTVKVNMSARINANVTVSVNGMNYTVSIVNGEGELPLANLTNTTYYIQAFFTGNEKYMANASNIIAIKVNKVRPTIYVTNKENYDVPLSPITAGSDVTLFVHMSPDINGVVELIVEQVGSNNPKPYYVAIVDGNGKYTVNNLANATYDIKVMFEGDDKYEAVNATAKLLRVNMIVTKLNISIDKPIIFVGDKAVVSIQLNQSMNAVVTVKVNGANYTVGLVNGKGTFTLADFAEGNYTINAVFAGDNDYVQSTSNPVTLNVTKIPTGLKVNTTSVIVVGSDAVINITLNQTINTTVVLRVNGNEYNVAIVDGFGNFSVAHLPVGTYHVNATYAGDNKYVASTSQTVEFNVTETAWEASVIAQNATVEENPSFVITAPMDFDGNLSIKVDNIEYYNGVLKTLTEISKF
jgi:ribosomal protein L9